MFSSVTRTSHRHILPVDAHHESSPAEPIERALGVVGIRVDLQCDIGRVDAAEAIGGIPCAALVVAEHADDAHAVGVLQRERQTMSLEHCFDRVPVIVGDAAKQEVGVGRWVVRFIAHQQLRDDFVGA